jgi:hypothetical protein
MRGLRIYSPLAGYPSGHAVYGCPDKRPAALAAALKAVAALRGYPLILTNPHTPLVEFLTGVGPRVGGLAREHRERHRDNGTKKRELLHLPVSFVAARDKPMPPPIKHGEFTHLFACFTYERSCIWRHRQLTNARDRAIFTIESAWTPRRIRTGRARNRRLAADGRTGQKVS